MYKAQQRAELRGRKDLGLVLLHKLDAKAPSSGNWRRGAVSKGPWEMLH